MTASVQTFNAMVTMRWDWDHVSRTWHVSVYRTPVRYRPDSEREVLWEGAVAE